MERSADAFRTISEVAEDLDLPQHVLRFWETRFIQIKPLKRGGGRRYYRPDDVELLRAIRHLLYGEGYTIRGVQRILKEQGVKAVIALVRSGAASKPTAPESPARGDLPAEPIVLARPSAETDEFEDEPPFRASREDRLAPAGAGALAPNDIARLQAALSEIAECARILQAARA